MNMYKDQCRKQIIWQGHTIRLQTSICFLQTKGQWWNLHLLGEQTENDLYKFTSFFVFRNFPDTASHIRGWMQMVLTPNDLFSWNNKYNEYRLDHYFTLQWIYCHFPAMHVDLLCACWYLWAVKGSSSSSFCRLLISPRFTSCHLLCPKLTDAPYPAWSLAPPFLFQNGVFIHRVRTLSLLRVRHSNG
jgi:hypothetical protein